MALLLPHMDLKGSFHFKGPLGLFRAQHHQLSDLEAPINTGATITNASTKNEMARDTNGLEANQPSSNRQMLLPSELERKGYYYGIPGCPQLVARSNASEIEWYQRFEDQHQVKKQFSRVGQHPIVEAWDAKLAAPIIDILNDNLDGWNNLNVLRIGESDAYDENPVIVWVGVLPGSTLLQLGMRVALQCHALLTDHGFRDVHCEIHEAVVKLSASAPGDQPVVRNLDVNDDHITHSREDPAAFTDTIGQCVAMEANPSREATLGCFLDAAKERNTCTAKYAIISRHLVFPDDDVTEYRYRKSAPIKHVIMPGDVTLNKTKDHVSKNLDSWTRYLAHLYRHSGQQQQGPDVESVQQYIAKDKKFLEYLNSLSSHKSRRISYVEFSPARQFDNQTQSLPDFAIVKLDEGRFTRLQDLVNMVYIADKPDGINKNFTWNAYIFPPDERVLRLQGVVPVADLMSPWTVYGRETNDKERVLRVGKRGQKSRLTWGEVNELKGVKRHKVNNQSVVSQHLIVIGLDRNAPFSKKGDSGSAIFTPDGKLVAMLDGGKETHTEDPTNGGVTTRDLTFATPYAWILDHIHRAGYSTAYFC